MLWQSIEDLPSDEVEEGKRGNLSDIQTLTVSPFQFSYADDADQLKKRFQQWLEEVVLTGLEYWNKSL